MRKFITTSLFLITPVLITLLIASKLNIKIYKISSPSMEPEIPLNSLVIVQKPKILRVGDVISYKQSDGNSTITHRITNISFVHGRYFFNTKGDSNKEKDPQPISEKEIAGKVVTSIPYLGTLVVDKNNPLFIISILTGFILGIFFKKISL
jgi:signal peptidase I